MWPKLGNSSISMREVTIASILNGFDQKNQFFEECSLFKFYNLGLVADMALKFSTNAAKRLKLKVKKFWGLVPTEKQVGEFYAHHQPPPHPHILKRVIEGFAKLVNKF